MASSAPNRVQPARASSVLTTGEVAATSLDLNEIMPGSCVLLDVNFTLGSLTNVILKAYVSTDGVTFVPLREGPAALVATVTLTASDAFGWSLRVPSGYKYFRTSATGTGTVTGSLLATSYRYVKRGTL